MANTAINKVNVALLQHETTINAKLSPTHGKLPICQRHGSIDIKSNVIMFCMMHYITNITKPNIPTIYFEKFQNTK